MTIDAAKINATALREFLDAMHEHADIRDARTKSIAGIVADARGKGYDGKALRKIFVRERMDAEQRQRDDAILAAYMAALGGKGAALAAIAAGVPVGEAAKANGVHRATVARARNVAKQPSNATPHDPETGEIKGDQPEPRKSASDASGPTISGDQPPLSESPSTACGGVESRHASPAKGATALGNAVTVAPSASAGVAPGPQDLSMPDIPDYLRRVA